MTAPSFEPPPFLAGKSWFTFDEKGVPVPATLEEWAAFVGEEPARFNIARDRTAGGRLVSTVFIGFDREFFGDGPPKPFETMLFPANADLADPSPVAERRSATRDEALAAHRALLLDGDRAGGWG